MKKMEGAEWLMSRPRRYMDVVGALALSPVVLPAGLAAAAIALSSPGGAIFRQTRFTRNCEPFTIYKLRTMPTGTPERPSTLGAAEPNATSLGRRLRAAHLDEAPQLLNIFKGTMSLVGFRPVIGVENENTLDVLSPEEQKAWLAAQTVVNGGLFSDYSIKLHKNGYQGHNLRDRALDTIEYAGRASLAVDLRILAEGLEVGIDGIGQLFGYQQPQNLPRANE